MSPNVLKIVALSLSGAVGALEAAGIVPAGLGAVVGMIATFLVGVKHP